MNKIIKKSIALIKDLFSAVRRKKEVLLVSSGDDWIVNSVCRGIHENLQRKNGAVVSRLFPLFTKNKTIHFVARSAIFNEESLKKLSRCNKIILTWWHGGAYPVKKNKEHDNWENELCRLSDLQRYIDIFHITSSLYESVLENHGISREKIVHIPMGIDLERFRIDKKERKSIRGQLKISPGTFVIGSFQQDGKNLPKLVKGPDIFVKVLRKVFEREKNILVLLTGPSRGYLRRNFDKYGIPYKFVGLLPSKEISRHYQTLDLYLITSREEGGPAAVLEAQAAGVPLVSTKVGMAVDVIKDGENGILTDIEDINALTDNVLKIIKDSVFLKSLAENGLEYVKQYGWAVITKSYEDKLYS